MLEPECLRTKQYHQLVEATVNTDLQKMKLHEKTR